MLELLTEIQSLQSKGDAIYPDRVSPLALAVAQGVFPSQRKHKATGIGREDDNSFFTALIIFTLLRLKRYFSAEELKVVEEMQKQAEKTFPFYASKKVNGTYNFWRTEKNAHFPNGNIFSKFHRFSLADDADCTALVYLAKGYTTDDIVSLKNKLIHYSTLPLEVSSNTLPRYRNLKLYSTWFGKYIPIETDVCVIANLVYLFFESRTSLNEYDLDCIKFICSVINNEEHKSQPFRVAPYYPKTSIILYHISRLLTVANHPDLLQLNGKLKADIFEKLSGDIHPMERIILNTSLMCLDKTSKVEELEIPVDTNFPWFVAGMLTSINNPFAKAFSSSSLFHLQFYCEAYMKTLFLEYKTLKDNLISRL